MCRVTMGHLRVTIGHLRVNVGHPRVTIGHLRATMGHLRLTIGYLKATLVHIRVTIGYFSISKHKAITTELHLKGRQTCYVSRIIRHIVWSVIEQFSHQPGLNIAVPAP